MTYPFKTDAIYPRNRWYVAAAAAEIGRRPFERTICDTPVVFYRTEAGTPVAMNGICPHRYYPLALGRLAGDAIECGYHGFTFAASGKCIRVPSQNTGAGFSQPTYPTIERGPFVWIWMGDKNKADPALLPPHEDFGLDQEGWVDCGVGYLHIQGRAQLLIDNLMDLTHVAFIHSQLAGGDALLDTPLLASERDRSHRYDRPAKLPWTEFHDFLFGPENRFEGLSEMISRTDFYGPEAIRTTGPITLSVEGLDEVPPVIGDVYFLHFVTPETKTTTHYFGTTTRNHRLDDAAFSRHLALMDAAVRQQDVAAIDQVERRLEQSAARQSELLSRSDGPTIRIRGLIQQMIDAEAA